MMLLLLIAKHITFCSDMMNIWDTSDRSGAWSFKIRHLILGMGECTVRMTGYLRWSCLSHRSLGSAVVAISYLLLGLIVVSLPKTIPSTYNLLSRPVLSRLLLLSALSWWVAIHLLLFCDTLHFVDEIISKL